MSDIVAVVRGFLSMSWNFLMHTYIPGTEISYGVMFVGLCVISIGFRFLSLAVGFSIGDWTSSPNEGYGKPPVITQYRISDGRKKDVR